MGALALALAIVQPDPTLADLTKQLRAQVAGLREKAVADFIIADVEVYLAAIERLQRLKELTPATTKSAVDVARDGLERAELAARGQAPWRDITGKAVVYGYRSSVDGSAQPYVVTKPAGYERGRKYRLDVVLHGRDDALTEVKFIRQHANKAAPNDQSFVKLEAYGRGNNAYRWAGETDVFEASGNLVYGERANARPGSFVVNLTPVVLRGFSMGGAGTWHMGLHHPTRWAAIGPGAGFSTTRGYVKDLPAKLPPHVADCLHIYDAVDYAENAANVSVVAYAGDQDPQMQAGKNIEAALKPHGIPMTFLIAPGLKHKMPPEWEQKAEAEYAKAVASPRLEYPARFVTYTLKYPHCGPIRLLGLERHYREARVTASMPKPNEIVVTTKNVTDFTVNAAFLEGRGQSVAVDGDRTLLLGRPLTTQRFVKQDGRWRCVTEKPPPATLRKSPGRTGPIDDAFTSAFVCVRGTGTPAHAAIGQYADAELKRFAAEWDRYLRGTLPMKDDTAITDDDIAKHNLVLFGDPQSNKLIARIVNKLPLTWTVETLTLNGTKYDARTHLPALIFPNPLNPTKYVVLNSGHTFHEPEFKGTNALLYPRLGDYAVLKVGPTTEVVTAGLFDDDWRLTDE